MQLIARVVALVPPAGCALVKYFGVLAPAARTRPRIVPAVSRKEAQGKARWHPKAKRDEPVPMG